MFPDPTVMSVFTRGSYERIEDITVPIGGRETVSLVANNPCITDPPIVCYEVAYYHFSVSVPPSADGYIVASQVNYRINGISNLSPGYGSIGATYTADIPGTDVATNGPVNTSARFTGSDLVIVCANNSMSYSFAATDGDGDQLEYSFCEAYASGSSGNGVPAPEPPYSPVPYYAGEFNGNRPLGTHIQINPNSGLISGVAPGEGVYVVTVCVTEIRNGVIIATQRKDLQIKIASCTIAAATLFPSYMLCDESTTLNIANLSTSPLIKTYLWEFISPSGNTIFTSTNPTLSYTFPDTGVYKIKLSINEGQPCFDTTSSIAVVFPGFATSMDLSGICYTKATSFTDRSTTAYGVVNSWIWDFGEGTTLTDVSLLRNPTYTYPTTGTKNVNLIVSNSKGCKDTVSKVINIIEKPPINLAFRDTLICLPDVVQLQITSPGIYSWSPLFNIINANSATPVVSPATTTTYFIDLDENGCKNRDSVKVRVVDHVSLLGMNDTTICATDTILLRLNSNGFQFAWTPASQLINPSVKEPFAITNSTTTYEVTSRIGSCIAREQIQVRTISYPTAFAGIDTMVCHGTEAQLNGQTNGNRFFWTPSNGLNNPTILNPIAKPAVTTSYALFSFDNKGCPKPGIDEVIVEVLPDIVATAGRDTTVVIGQPLQLNAGGGVAYSWSPPIGLSSTIISSPIAIYNSETDNILYKVICYNEAGCADSAFIRVKVFKTRPSVFVPSAFSPNADGHNDILRPIAAGMKKIEYFNVYSRWGQLVFSSAISGQGWDGRIAGKFQTSGTYVWIVKAIDYKGSVYMEKGTVTLIR